MLVSAPPIPIDPSQIRLNMPYASLPKSSKSSLVDIFKIIIGLLIALIFAGILVVLIFFPRSSSQTQTIDLRESNENIAKLERQSNENLARLSREQQLSIEQQRYKQEEDFIKQKFEMEKERLIKEEDLMREKILLDKQRFERQENRTDSYRFEERSRERQRREEDLYLANKQLAQQLEIEQKRLQTEVQQHTEAEKHRREDLIRENVRLEIDFVKSIINSNEPWKQSSVEFQVQLLIRQLDPPQKSLLIHDLYKLKLINGQESIHPSLDLNGANLQDIDVDNVDDEPDLVTPRLNYNRLSLPSTKLINASFQNLDIQDADFSSSNMLGVLFRWSNVQRTNFNRSTLSLSDFRAADLTESHFSNTKLSRAHFSSSLLTRALMTESTLDSSVFEHVSAIEINLSYSELSNTNFQYANLHRSRFDHVSGQTINFYLAKAMQANFTMVYMPNCIFIWTDLTNASFRNAFLAGAIFENANVVDVDFTRAMLSGATITQGQLDVALSIANAVLPDGSIGRNKNLVQNGDANCSGVNSMIEHWFANENVIVTGNQTNNECVFQATADNATFLQMIDINRYRPLIENGQGKVYFEMQDNSNVNSTVYVMLRFFDNQQYQIGQGVSSLGMALIPKLITTFPCPANAVQILLSVVFQEENATIDNIYLTIE